MSPITIFNIDHYNDNTWETNVNNCFCLQLSSSRKLLNLCTSGQGIYY